MAKRNEEIPEPTTTAAAEQVAATEPALTRWRCNACGASWQLAPAMRPPGCVTCLAGAEALST